MAYTPYADLTEQQKTIFNTEDAYKSFMDSTQTAPTTRESQVEAIQTAMPSTTQDTSALTQATTTSQMVQPTLPSGTQITPQLQQVQTPEIQTTPGLTQPSPTAQAISPTAPTITSPTAATAAQVTPTDFNKVYQTYAATTGTPAAQMTAATGSVTQPAIAATMNMADMPKEATVLGQLENISNDVISAQQAGQPLPVFASAAQRIADAAMAKRGLSSSSIAAEAIARGVLDASIPIAAQDAQTYSQIVFQNLNNRQQSAVLNAQQYFQMDMANLDNNQQANLQNVQLRQQTLLSDQSAQNAAKQFNATSQSQTDQFFDSLQSQIKQYNANAYNSMAQFNKSEQNKISAINAQNKVNVDKANAEREAQISQFNTSVEDSRQRFNVENQRAIDQSNVVWRRQVNTANTAATNAANQTNVFNFAMSAFNFFLVSSVIALPSFFSSSLIGVSFLPFSFKFDLAFISFPLGFISFLAPLLTSFEIIPIMLLLLLLFFS